MIELFKNKDTLKEEIERLWNYRNLIDKLDDEKELLSASFDILNKHYSIESFLVKDTLSNSLYIVNNKSILSSEELSIVEDYSKHISHENDYFIYWNSDSGGNKESENIASLYFFLLLKSIQKLHIEQSIRYFSLRDSLTGLYNRKFLDEFCSVAEMQHIREKTTYAVIMIDIDHFKSVNDTYGHQVGDEVIKALASLIKERIRQSDVVARYGGEEFLVLLHNTNGQGAIFVAKSILESFKQMQFNIKEKPFSCSYSCGIDVLDSSNTKIETVIKNADAAMYTSKKNGRDMVSLFGGRG